MDNSTPFQPWTAKDGAKNVKSEKESVGDTKLHQENVNHSKYTQTASHDKETVVFSRPVPGSSSMSNSDASNPGGGVDTTMDSSKIASLQQRVEKTLSPESRQRVAQLLETVEALSVPERLLLYLRLPTGTPPHDPLKQPINPLGSRAELQQTVTWIQTHLEVDPDVSLPKQDVYDEYIAYCLSSNMKPLSTADFGKVMKQVYPSVRPRRLGTRGNSRYCYAGLRKKVKLEVPQLPDLSETSKEPERRDTGAERIVCEWAEMKLGMKFSSLLELSRHLLGVGSGAAAAASSRTSPPLMTLPQAIGDESSRQLMKQLKRKIQTQSTPGRPKKNKAHEVTGEPPPSTSYGPALAVKHESEHLPEPSYGFQPGYMYEVRSPFPAYGVPPRAHPPHAAPHAMPPMHAAMHDYRPDPYAFEPTYGAPRDFAVPSEITHNVPINLSSDASLDLSTERTEWPRRRPPEPPPARLPLPGKKLILETYQSETRAGSSRVALAETRAPAAVIEEFPRSEYLPKKMRAAEILGGKLAAARHAATDVPSTSTAPSDASARPETAFLEDPKNVAGRSKSTAAALVREEQKAASPARAVKAPTSKADSRRKKKHRASNNPESAPPSPDACCGLDGINLRTGVICEEKHSEILNRERVISICNMDKHALDDYLNEGSSQEHEEELLQYFQRDDDHDSDPPVEKNTNENDTFLGAGLDPQDDHSQSKNEKLLQLRELLARNLKNQSGSSAQISGLNQESQISTEHSHEQTPKPVINEGAFKPVYGPDNMNGQMSASEKENDCGIENNKDISVPFAVGGEICDVNSSGREIIYNGNCQNIPQSPTTRTQQYDFVPISDGCHSPGNFNAKSPLSFGHRDQSPSKTNKPVIMGGSLQTSPISHSTVASPFVSPRNTPVPRSRLCPRPIPKLNGRRRRTMLSLGMTDPCPKQFAIPNDQKIINKSLICGPGMKYCQPMSAPPSPSILSTQFKNQHQHGLSIVPNGNPHLRLNFMPNSTFRDNINGDLSQPLSADPLSSEVSQFFQESVATYRSQHDTSFRSQSVPLKQGVSNIVNMLSYNNTPVGSVPPTPVPHEFCDFGTLADTCDISKAGLNPESLDKIYDAIDSSNDVLNPSVTSNLLNSNNACNPLTDQQLLTEDQLNSFIPTENDLIPRDTRFDQTFSANNNASDGMQFDLTDIVTDKSKYYMSRSVPSTPLPFKRTVPPLHVDSRRSRQIFPSDNFANLTNGSSSKSVPSTPQMSDEHSVFSYSNRDFLINGNSVSEEACGAGAGPSGAAESLMGDSAPLDSPLQDMLREDMLAPLTPNADLLADLDKIDAPPYVDL